MVGDMWDHTAIAADSKLIVSLVVGKRPHEQTRALVHDTKKRLRPRHLPALFTDAYDGYEAAILEAFGRRYLGSDSRLPKAVPSPCPPLAPRLGVWAGEKTV